MKVKVFNNGKILILSILIIKSGLGK